jgi:hypothetical protein
MKFSHQQISMFLSYWVVEDVDDSALREICPRSEKKRAFLLEQATKWEAEQKREAMRKMARENPILGACAIAVAGMYWRMAKLEAQP